MTDSRRIINFMLLTTVLLVLALASGCISSNAVSRQYVFPGNTGRQIELHIDAKGELLMIPFALERPGTKNFSVKLEQPRIVHFPYNELPLMTGYQYVEYGNLWTTGRNGAILLFLLLDDKGRIYIMDTPDSPLIEHGGDIDFHQATLSSEWIADFLMEMNRKQWLRRTGFWNLPGLGIPAIFSWRDAEPSLAIVNDFLKKHPLKAQGDAGKWEKVYCPCFTPNVFCEAGLHKLPPFTSEQVLALTTKLDVYTGMGGFEYKDLNLLFPDGHTEEHLMGMEQALGRLCRTGKYRVISFDRRNEEKLNDPERNHPWAPDLRNYARRKGIPLVILYGDDANAPAYQGLPAGVRQYWQCPECARQYNKLSAKSGVELHTRNLLLFPINLVPDMLVGIISMPCAYFMGMCTSDEPGWFMVGLPFSPLAGAIFGLNEAWNGRPFWNMVSPP